MPITLLQIAPGSVKPGDQITLTGTGFAAGAAVIYLGTGVQYADTRASVVSATEITSTVPDLLLGVAGSLAVKVQLGEESSNELALTVQAHPAVDEPYPLCSLGQVREFLGVAASETLNDAKLAFLIKVASGQISGECGRNFSVQAYTAELYDGDGSNLLALRRSPVVKITALMIGGESIPVNEVKVYEQFLKFDDGVEYNPRLRSASRIFPRGAQNISVSYEAGYATVPAEISHACILQVMYLMNLGNRQGVISEGNNNAGTTTTYAQAALCPAARVACNRYRRPKVSIA
jgi:hypothetical protein